LVPSPLVTLIMDRLRVINQTFRRLADRIGAGLYVPRSSAPRRPPVHRKPRRPSPLPEGYAWLVKLVPEAAAYGSQLQFLLADPEVAALLATAPGALRRPLRSLCLMLAASPPAILALPRRTRPPRPRKPRAPRVRLAKLPRPLHVFTFTHKPPRRRKTA